MDVLPTVVGLLLLALVCIGKAAESLERPADSDPPDTGGR